MERQNPSSYAKTRPVLRTDSELEDKTRTIRAKGFLRWLWIDVNSKDKCNKLDGMDQGLMDTKETQQDLKVFTDYDEKQREKHKLD